MTSSRRVLICYALSFPLPLLNLPVSYGGLRTQTWRPCSPSFVLVYLRSRAVTQIAKHAFKWTGLSTPGLLIKMAVQDGN